MGNAIALIFLAKVLDFAALVCDGSLLKTFGGLTITFFYPGMG
jgi:hypothetical protein